MFWKKYESSDAIVKFGPGAYPARSTLVCYVFKTAAGDVVTKEQTYHHFEPRLQFFPGAEERISIHREDWLAVHVRGFRIMYLDPSKNEPACLPWADKDTLVRTLDHKSAPVNDSDPAIF